MNVNAEAIIALLNAAARLVPEIAQALPVAETIITGNKVTAAQNVQIWSAVVDIENLVVQKAAQIEAPTA